MRTGRFLTLCAAWVVLLPVEVAAQTPVAVQDLARYRQFQMGMALTAVANEVGSAREARVTHSRPALIRELDWYPPKALGGPPGDESVRQVSFAFYEGQLSRITIEYDRQRTEGLSVDDIIDALATAYGPATRPRVLMMASLSAGSHESDEILATWGDARSTATLYRPSYLSAFGLVVADRRLDGLARRAAEEAARIDALEGPQRDRDRQRAEREQELARLTKARQTNKGAFHP